MYYWVSHVCRALQLKSAECDELKERMLKVETEGTMASKELSLLKADKKKLDAQVCNHLLYLARAPG